MGISFDEYLCFHVHFVNLRARSLKRLNIIKIFSHSYWHLSKKTLIYIYRSLIDSIFDYSSFSVACVSKTSIGRIQAVQNRAIRIILGLKWDSPTNELLNLSGVLSIEQRQYQLGCRYVLNGCKFKRLNKSKF